MVQHSQSMAEQL